MESITAFGIEYSIKTVPGFIYIDGDIVNIKCDLSMQEVEIKTVINK